MQRTDSGQSRFEWCVLVACFVVMTACAVPMASRASARANASQDAMQLRTHYTWLQVYKLKHRRALPNVGGHKFVLATWTSKVFDHTTENLDLYFSPGLRDLDRHYQETRRLLANGEEPWPDASMVTTRDTHYVGRGRSWLRTAEASPQEAWMATDNEDGWVFADGSINVLSASGAVRTYTYDDLAARCELGAFDPGVALVTHGMDSPLPEAQKLDN